MVKPSVPPTILDRHNVQVCGHGETTLFLVHGFGCNQAMWRHMVPLLERDYKIVLFDHVGTSSTPIPAWEASGYGSLDSYVSDVVAVIEALDLRDLILVGHSVSAMICGLCAIKIPDRISQLVMIGGSARYINDDNYEGGFERSDIDGLLESIEQNYQYWSESMAPAIMGRPDLPHTGQELTERFCEQQPEVAYAFAKATFLSDNRADLANIVTPTLVLQCSDDIIAPEAVGKFLAENLPNATYRKLEARGHCPNLSAPEETAAAIREYLEFAHV